MYHCRLHFYLTGHRREWADLIKNTAPLAGFCHEFAESETPEAAQAAQADVILADLRETEAGAALKTLA